MKILIAGYGFVGKAHEEVLLDYAITCVADPVICETTVAEYANEVDAVVCCVSTPPTETGECDMSNIYDVISSCNTDTPILIKSTISIEGWEAIKICFPFHNITFSPEFLVAATAVQDFKNTRHLYLGGSDVEFWSKFFSLVFEDLEITEADPLELIMIKYGRNTFLATKVAYFNQLYDMCKNLGVDYNTVAYGIAKDKRIGKSHTKITKERGFGGHCFPKDTSAFVESSKQIDTRLTILEAAIDYNNRLKNNDC